MQSNKSSKERDGAAKDKQIAFFFFFFYKTVFPAMVFLAADSERRSEGEKKSLTQTDRQR